MKKLSMLIFLAFLVITRANAATTWIYMGEYLGSDEEDGCCTVYCQVNNNLGCYSETDDNGTLGNVYLPYEDDGFPANGGGPTPGTYITLTTLDPQTQNAVNTYQGYFKGATTTDNGDGSFSSAIYFKN